MKKWWLLRRTEGQSLVELAFALIFLLVLFTGLVEVGAALRNYLVVVNANREGTRFAARGRWFDSVDEVQEIFGRVVAAGGTERRGDEDVHILRPTPDGEWAANTAIRIHYIQIPDQINQLGQSMDEDYVIHGPWYTGTLHLIPDPSDDPLEPPKLHRLARQAQEDNREFNAKYFVQDQLLDIPSEDNFVIVEVWFEHEQLLKLPYFTPFLPERIRLYAQTTMRVTLDSRIE